MTGKSTIELRPHEYYPDRGCQYAPACLACPLPKCVDDMDIGERRQVRLAARAREIGPAVFERNPSPGTAKPRRRIPARRRTRIRRNPVTLPASWWRGS